MTWTNTYPAEFYKDFASRETEVQQLQRRQRRILKQRTILAYN